MSVLETTMLEQGFDQLKAIAERLDPGCNPQVTLSVNDKGNGALSMFGRGFKFRRWVTMPVTGWAIDAALIRALRHMRIVADNWDNADSDAVEAQLRAAGCLS